MTDVVGFKLNCLSPLDLLAIGDLKAGIADAGIQVNPVTVSAVEYLEQHGPGRVDLVKEAVARSASNVEPPEEPVGKHDGEEAPKGKDTVEDTGDTKNAEDIP